MIVYFTNGDRFIDLSAFAYIASIAENQREALKDNFKVIGSLKHYDRIVDLYQGTSRECDRLVKETVAAKERGEDVFRTGGRTVCESETE